MMNISYHAPYVLERANSTDAGWDLRAVEETVFFRGDRKLVKTGLCLGGRESSPPAWVYPKGFHIDVRGRSSMWKHGFNTFAGLVDEDYHSEILVGLEWTGLQEESGYDNIDRRLRNVWSGCPDDCYVIKPGHKIAQLVFMDHENMLSLTKLSEPPAPKRGGFGSSGQ